MSIDNEIEQAFERHSDDVRPVPGAWQEVQRRVRRRHRTRLAATALGAAVAIAGTLVVIPRIGSEPNDRFDALPEGWRPIRSDQGGFRVGFPPGWKASDNIGVTVGVPPDAVSSHGKPLFTVTFSIVPEPYDRIPGSYHYAPDDGRMRGRRLNRYSESLLEEAFGRRIIYRIEWPRLCPDASCRGSYTLVASISATDQALWDRYRSTAERVVRTAEPAPVSRPLVPARVQAKIPANAIALSATGDNLWALLPSPDGIRPGSLARIDPGTNQIVERMSVGVAPAELVATPYEVWVSHGRCAAPASCPTASETEQPSFNSVWRIELPTKRVLARIHLEGAHHIAFSEGAAWVTGTARLCCGPTVYKIDMKTNRIVADIGVGGEGDLDIATGEGLLWAVTRSGPGARNIVSLVDPIRHRVIEVIDVPAGFNSPAIAFGFGTGWVTTVGRDSPSGLARIDPKSMKVTRTISVPEAGNTAISLLTLGDRVAWTVNGRGELSKIDSNRNLAIGDPFAVGDIAPIYANDLVTGFGSVWVASGDGQIWRISP
jgi:DNA-binding beta-propeller fold protein YncE